MPEPLDNNMKEKIALELCENLGCRTNAFEDFRLSSRYPIIVNKCITGQEGKKIAEWLCENDEIFQSQKVETVSRKVNRFKKFLAEKAKAIRFTQLYN